jgi:AAA family ATP:ADP antiporter
VIAGIQPEMRTESTAIHYCAASVLLMTAAFVLTKTGRDALYFQEKGLLDLPWAYLGMALLAVPFACLVLRGMLKTGACRARIAGPLLMALVQVCFFPFVKPGGGWVMTFFFLLVPLAYGVLLSMAWLLGAELVIDAPQRFRTRGYSTLGSASILGGVGGGLSAKALAPWLDPDSFLVVGAAGLIFCSAVTLYTQRRFLSAAPLPGGRFPTTKEATMPPLTDLFGTLKHRYVAWLFVIAVVASLVGVLIEFQFYLVAATRAGDAHDRSDFFASFYFALNGVALFLQIVGMPWLQRRIGVSGSLLVLPAALLDGSAWVLLTLPNASRTALRVIEGGLKASVHRPNWEQTYLSLERSPRALAKLLVDGMGARIGEGMAGALLLVWLQMISEASDTAALATSWIPYALLSGTLLWTGFGFALGHCFARECPDLQDGRFHLGVPLPDC